MVDTVIRTTAVVVLTLAALNALHALVVGARLARHVARQRPYCGLGLWLPAFQSIDDVRAWLLDWRRVLTAPDAGALAVRQDAALVVSRHVQLAITANTWALAVLAIT